MGLRPTVGASVERQSSGASPLEWRAQALVVGCNVLPVLLFALAAALASLAAGAVTGGLFWFLGGIFVAFILGYALFYLIIVGALWLQRSWARFAAMSVLLLYILFFAWVGSAKPREASPTPPYLRGHSVEQLPAWVRGTLAASRIINRSLPVINAVAIAHLVLRWRQFSRSAKLDRGLGNVNPG